jgi:hypothetical protein
MAAYLMKNGIVKRREGVVAVAKESKPCETLTGEDCPPPKGSHGDRTGSHDIGYAL